MESPSPRDNTPSEEGSSYVLSTEAATSSFSGVDSSESSIIVTPRRKRKRKLETPIPPERPDNVQTRKLRPPQHLRQQKQETPSISSESEIASPEPELIRSRTVEEMRMDLERIQGMWETTVVFHFLHTFQNQLQLMMEGVKMEEIEEAIVRSNGQGLLAQLHMELMRGLKPKVAMDASNWTAAFSRKLRAECWESDDNPFNPERGREAEAYCNATVEQRVLALKMLCEIRCSENDVRDLIDLHLKPKPKIHRSPKRKHKKGGMKILPFRGMPIGQLNVSTLYWFLEAPKGIDFRVYKETREHIKKTGKGKGLTRVKNWDLIAYDVDGLRQLCNDLPPVGTNSRHLKKKILEELLPDLEKHMEQEERKLRAAERLRQHHNEIILDLDGGYGRPVRMRSEAKYTFEEYEKAMAEAIDDGVLYTDDDGSYESDDIEYDDDMSIVENGIRSEDASMDDRQDDSI